MNVHTAAKRAACDRCHRLKMRCIVAGSTAQGEAPGPCSRCRVAEAPCHYSVPRKPGRPPTKPPGAQVQALALSPELAGTLPSTIKGASTVGDTAQVEDTPGHRPDGPLSVSSTESFAEFAFDAASWPFLNFPDDFLSDAGALLPSIEVGGYLHHSHHTQTQHPDGQFVVESILPPPQLPPTPLTPPRRAQGSAPVNEPVGARLSGTDAPSIPAEFERGQRQVRFLSDFNVRLARAIDVGPDAGPIKLEHAAAHVLESSAIFLDLAKSFQCTGGRDTTRQCACGQKRPRPGSHTQLVSPVDSLGACDDHERSNNNNNNDDDDDIDDDGSSHGCYIEGGQDAVAPAGSTHAGPFVLDMATVLQLVVFSMRLTELHHSLYSAIYRYLRQQQQQLDHSQHPNRDARTGALFSSSSTASSSSSSSPHLSSRPPPSSSATAAAESLFPLPVSLTIAGINLTPPPRFQLELVLQAGAYYLCSIQEALHSLKALRPEQAHGHDPQTSAAAAALPQQQQQQQRPVSGAILVRLLMMQDQQGRMGAIREVLGKLRDEFGVAVQL